MVYQVMIVDDDINFRYALKEMIPWEKNGYHVAAEAIHGKQALEMMDHQLIHIVVTDMDMPVMNGVELTGQIKKKFPGTMVIACSAYDDFRFVKEAMRLGAEDYILKQDLDGEQVITLLRKLFAGRRQQRSEQIQQELSSEGFMEFLAGKQERLPQTIPGFIRIQACSRIVLMLVYNQGSETDLYDRTDLDILLVQKVSEDKWIVLLEQPSLSGMAEEAAWLESAASLLAGSFCGTTQVGLSDEYADAGSLPQLYKKAAAALKYGYMYTRKKVLHYLDIRRFEERADEELTFPSDKDLSAEQFIQAVEGRIRLYMPDSWKTDRFLASCYMKWCRNHGIEENETAFFEQVKSRYFLDDKLAFMREMTDRHQVYAYHGTHPEIKAVVRYIQQHYAEDITLKDAADIAGLSENYFSNLFKQELGENFTAYINRVRIEQAKELLDHTNMRVYEVAEAVGFRNTTYFSTMFRKLMGMPVSEYRRRREG